MKKKIKDLTIIEANEYCFKRSCGNCPCKDNEEFCVLELITGYKIKQLSREVLEREVEIDESDND